MSTKAETMLPEVLSAYDFGAEIVGTVRTGKGHINDTFCIYTQADDGACRRYILQRMSAAAFKRPDQLMQNIVGVTDYLREEIAKNGGDPDRETMTVTRTKGGAAYCTDSEGGAWRVYPFIEGTVCLQQADTPELFYASAKAFGKFQKMLKAYPADTLFDIYTKGFLEGADHTLTPAELQYLPWGAKLMTLECGTRFLTDYLEGDTYFHTTRPAQNLDRTRTQFKLVSDMENQWDAMNETVQKYN